MAPKADRPKQSQTIVLGHSSMTKALIANMVSLSMLVEGGASAPLRDETTANPQDDEIVVFRDFFIAGLRFPVDPVFVNILHLYGMYMHQLTPNCFIRLILYFWLAKTYDFIPTAEGFAYIHKVHYQSKTVSPLEEDGQEGEAQYGCYTFVYREFVFGPVMAYHNKWEDWTSFWFYHKVPLDPATGTQPLHGEEN
ncbi:hypothetical protein C2845_PM07G04800 [Panicum miliaceum]|uniref:Transposase (putative) gypsy type domain-containing protein n=1 Tax=Panicum miliaceum TaxID=4540 RepID=A0A3L6SSG7_PANMI|nr:hypothetical protein C2845_PM07G04800 [Panicum miliaceum]